MMTLTGTNTDRRPRPLLDRRPGPAARRACRGGRRRRAGARRRRGIVVTHDHHDHFRGRACGRRGARRCARLRSPGLRHAADLVAATALVHSKPSRHPATRPITWRSSPGGRLHRRLGARRRKRVHRARSGGAERLPGRAGGPAGARSRAPVSRAWLRSPIPPPISTRTSRTGEREARLVAALDEGRRTHDELLDAAWSEVPDALRGRGAHARPPSKLAEEGRLLTTSGSSRGRSRCRRSRRAGDRRRRRSGCRAGGAGARRSQCRGWPRPPRRPGPWRCRSPAVSRRCRSPGRRSTLPCSKPTSCRIRTRLKAGSTRRGGRRVGGGRGLGRRGGHGVLVGRTNAAGRPGICVGRGRGGRSDGRRRAVRGAGADVTERSGRGMWCAALCRRGLGGAVHEHGRTGRRVDAVHGGEMRRSGRDRRVGRRRGAVVGLVRRRDGARGADLTAPPAVIAAQQTIAATLVAVTAAAPLPTAAAPPVAVLPAAAPEPAPLMPSSQEPNGPWPSRTSSHYCV